LLSSAADDSRAAQCAHSKTHLVPRETLSTHFDTQCAFGVARWRCSSRRVLSPPIAVVSRPRAIDLTARAGDRWPVAVSYL